MRNEKSQSFKLVLEDDGLVISESIGYFTREHNEPAQGYRPSVSVVSEIHITIFLAKVTYQLLIGLFEFMNSALKL